MPTNPNGNAKQIMLTLAAFRHMLRAGRPNSAGIISGSPVQAHGSALPADLDGRTNTTN